MIEEAQVVMLECFGHPQSKKKVAAEEAAESALWYFKQEGYISQPRVHGLANTSV